ncbi:sensor histidine kinase [Halomonas cupida]|uniref:sensor histidine kinase n=1 Tax=Halomonas cupida TaxID=44933 RepID=UPI003A95217C
MFRIDLRSLRTRLLLWLSGIALLVVGATWILHGILLADLARDFLGDRLAREADHAIEILEQERPAAREARESSQSQYRILHHLYVLRVGEQVTASDDQLLQTLTPLLNEADDAVVEVRNGEQHLLVYRRHFRLAGNTGVLLLGEDFSRVEAGLGRLHWWVAGIAAGVLMLLVVLNLLAINGGLIPLSRIRDELEALQTGQRERLSTDVPSELDRLVAQFNHFLDEIDRRLKRSRDSVANLSHALKTPLAAVTQVLRGERPIDAQRRLKLVQRLEDVHMQLDAELRRARIAGPHAGRLGNLERDSTRLIEMFRSLYPQKRFHLALPDAADRPVPIESQDLSEMLGIVLDNAGKWASHEVHCHLEIGRDISITVEDDGPGVADEDLSRLGQRGMRLDEQSPGYGLGLSILRQLVARYSGRVWFESRCGAGLRVKITIPVKEGGIQP